MANRKTTQLTELTEIQNDDWFYVIDKSDTTESAEGTSKKIKKSNTIAFIKSNESLSLAQRKDDVIYGILDQHTGEELTLSKVTGTPTVDGIIYFQLGSEYFKRVYNEINLKWFGSSVIIQQMFNYSNSVFIIDKDYNLGGNSFNILTNSVLKFKNGKFLNGSLNFQSGCKIENPNNKLIFDEIVIIGILNCEARSSYFANSDDDILFDNLVQFRKAYLEKSIYLDSGYTIYNPSNRRIKTSFTLIGIGEVTISSRNSLYGDIALNGGVGNLPIETIIIGDLQGENETVEFFDLMFLDTEYDEGNTTAAWDNSLSFINILFNTGTNNTLSLKNCKFKTTGQNAGINNYTGNTDENLCNFYAVNCDFTSLAWPSIGSFSAVDGPGIKEIIVDNCNVSNGTTFINRTAETSICTAIFKNCKTNGFFEINTPKGLDNLEINFLNCIANNQTRAFYPQNTSIETGSDIPAGNIKIQDCIIGYVDASFVRGYKNISIMDTYINIDKNIDILYTNGDFIFENIKIKKTTPDVRISFRGTGRYFFNNVFEEKNGMSTNDAKTAIVDFQTGTIKEFFNINATINYLTVPFVIKNDLLIFNKFSNNFHSITLKDIDTCENGNPYSISNGAIYGTKTINFLESSSTNVLILDFDINILKNLTSNEVITAVFLENKTNAAIRYGVSIYKAVKLLISNREYQDSNVENDISLGKHHVRIYFSQNIVYIYLNDMLFDFYSPNFSFTTINLSDFKLVMYNTNNNVELTNVKLLQL